MNAALELVSHVCDTGIRAETATGLMAQITDLHGLLGNASIVRRIFISFGLQPDQPDPEADRSFVLDSLLDICVLGVNTNVQPKIPVHRRMDNLPVMSTKFNESEDSEITGFVFHQIGILEFWESWGGDGGGSVEDNDVESSKDVDRGKWRPTGFHVVVRFRRSGAANGIYIIYNFYPKDEEGDHYLKINSDRWGRLPDDKTRQQFSMAKIADTMTELQRGRLFTLMEVFDYPVEIVMTWKTPEGIIARVTVA
ncbi:MAG: hypothetical protein M1839_001723 [Geoglossum umbratile]|nr:MAG: hypothetical protein M1839_001723 [Geoglossum umbratile]